MILDNHRIRFLFHHSPNNWQVKLTKYIQSRLESNYGVYSFIIKSVRLAFLSRPSFFLIL